jgi:hypothetical protein
MAGAGTMDVREELGRLEDEGRLLEGWEEDPVFPAWDRLAATGTM